VLFLLLCGCDRTRVERVESGIVAHYLSGCAPARADRMTVEALGDFGIRDDALLSFDARAGKTTLSSLPFEAKLFRLRVETPDFQGVAIAPAGEHESTFDGLVLPLGRHCQAIEKGLPAREGAARVMLEGGDVLLAGGTGAQSSLAEADAYRLELALGRAHKDAMGMLVPRALAVGVRVGGESWIVGGAQSVSEGSPSLASFERYDSKSGVFASLGRLEAPRARAGAVRLLDGSVLVAGGERMVGGEALDTLERISGDGKTSRLLDVRLPWPAESPVLLAGDDGLVWIAARVHERLALALFDPTSEQIHEIETPASGLEFSPPVALPGARLAVVETRSGVTTGVIHLVLADGSGVTLSDWLTSFAGLASLQLEALHDGRILLVGKAGERPTSRVIDVGRREVRVRELERPVDGLLLRDDGAVAELSGASALILREDERTPYDNPAGTLLAADADALALDAHTRWQQGPLELVSNVAGARFDLAFLAYEEMRVELDVSGDSELILRRADGAERVIDLSATRVGPALCTLARANEGLIVFERSGENLRIQVEGRAESCRLEGMAGPLSVAFRALDPGVRVRSLVVVRN
jgi:hypothetical protein